jgi:hypothetical protein
VSLSKTNIKIKKNQRVKFSSSISRGLCLACVHDFIRGCVKMSDMEFGFFQPAGSEPEPVPVRQGLPAAILFSLDGPRSRSASQRLVLTEIRFFFVTTY